MWRATFSLLFLLSFSLFAECQSPYIQNGCLDTGVTTTCTDYNHLGDSTDHVFPATPHTSWVKVINLDNYAYVKILLQPAIYYEFRTCNGGTQTDGNHELVIFQNTDIPPQAKDVLAVFDGCDGCQSNTRNWGPYSVNAAQVVLVTNFNTQSCDHTAISPVTLEMRVQPCPTCLYSVTPLVFLSAGATTYNLLTNAVYDELQPTKFGPYYGGCDNNLLTTPTSISCPLYDIPQQIYLYNSVSHGLTNCSTTVTVHDSVPSVITCPDGIVGGPRTPGYFQTTTLQCLGSTYNPTTGAFTYCNIAPADFPPVDWYDECESADPARFGAVTPVSATSGVYNPSIITQVDVTYNQLQQDQSTVSTQDCYLIATMIHIVYPNTYLGDTPYFPISRDTTYPIYFGSSVEYLPLGSTVPVYETEFRIILYEVTPPPGDSPDIVVLTSQLATKSTHNLISYGSFEVLPSLNLRSNLYYLLLQGRNSKIVSVTNPILNIAQP